MYAEQIMEMKDWENTQLDKRDRAQLAGIGNH